MSRVLSAQAPDCLQSISSAREGCENLISRFATDQTIPRAGVMTPRGDNTTIISNSTDATNSTTASTGSNSSAHTISIVVATVGLVFVGFLLYFAWQCIGCIRGSRSGKPVFGYVGV
ncbi:hypothetical protein RSOLAG22IIIB_04089 [Rhizoctonia solani]|uniref:Uncharacterized protein n=1 Tax=Rhizoctonia solani TaxID=456999 RepID=A0A0K6FUA7_9AGAM|nr:hypothetical protein RSOLAG22IIIB_04089 [Rhizoctonia solani]